MLVTIRYIASKFAKVLPIVRMFTGNLKILIEHITPPTALDARGFYLQLAGSSWDRTMETVRFFLALYRAGLPVVLYEAKLLASRLEGTEKMGIVPEGVYPIYCRSMFPGEKIIDFIAKC